MKKLTKVSLFAIAALSAGIMTTNAKTMTEEQLNSLTTINVAGQEISENLYIYGKYVYINTITSAELNDAMNDLLNDVEYAKSYRELFKDKVAALIHKDSNNNWENLTYGGSLAKTASIEMTHIIGDLKGDHLSNITNLYSDGSYVKTETLPSKKTAEIFVDEKAELTIAGIRAVSKIARLNNSDISTDTHRYNTSAVSINLDKKLNITKNKPLLTYNNGKDSGLWIGLIIKTNKPVTANDKIKLGTTVLELKDATEHGGDAREYVAWVKFDEISGKDLTLEINNKVTQTIKTNVVDNIKEVIQIDNVESESEPVVANLSENLQVASALINGKYTIFLYGEKTYNDSTTVDFTINGDMKRAVKDSSWSVADLIDVLSVKATPLTASDKDQVEHNKKAITGTDLVKEKGKLGNDEYEYVVTVHTNKVPDLNTGIQLDIDLSAKVSDLNKSAATDDSDTTYTVTLNTKESVVKFTNDSEEVTQTVGVKFVIVDETPEVELNIVPGNAGENVNVYSNPNPTQAGSNVNYRYNMNRASFTTKKDENGNYTVTIQEKSLASDSRLVKFQDSEKFTDEAYWFGFIVTLAKDPLASAKNYTVKKAGADLTVNDVLVADAKNIGATSDNAFALWVKGTDGSMSSSYTITDVETQKKVTITFEIKIIDEKTIKDVDDENVVNVVPTEEYASSVKYDSTRKDFTINTDTEMFVAKTTVKEKIAGVDTNVTREYTYRVLTNGTDEDRCGFGPSDHDNEKCVRRVQNLELKNVYAIEKDGAQTAQPQYNLDAVENVTMNGNEINVVLNKNIEGTFALAFDFGIGEYKTASNENVVLKGNSALEAVLASRFEKNAPSNIKELAFTWITYTPDKDIELTLKHKVTVASVALESEEYKVVIKVTVDNKAKELELKKAEKAVFDPNYTHQNDAPQAPFNSGVPKNVMDNDPFITSISFDGNTVTASYDHELNTKGSDKFAILMDLGIDPTYLNVSDGSANAVTIDKSTATALGYSGTEFLLIVDNSKITNGSIELTFDQNKDANKDNRYGKELKVSLVVKNEIDNLTISSSDIVERSADIKSVDGDFSYDNLAYAANQNNFDYEFKSTSVNAGTLTIKPSSENAKPSYYVLGGSGSPLAWYAISFDLGVELDESISATHGRIEKVDLKTGKFVLWYNTADASSNLTVKNAYNETGYTLTINSSK